MFHSFFIWGKEGIMEHWVDFPRRGKLQAGVCGGSREDFKWTMTLWGKLEFGVCGFNVGSF